MADIDPGLILAVTNVVSGIAGWLVKQWQSKKDVQEEAKKQLSAVGLDLIEDHRQEIATKRAELQRVTKELEGYRAQAWQWRHMHTEEAIENDHLKRQNEDLRRESARLRLDCERYQADLTRTADIRPPRDDLLAGEDSTGPTPALGSGLGPKRKK